MGADISSWFVDHPQLGDRLLQLQSLRGVRLEIGLNWDQHILIDPLAVDPDEAQLDKIFGLPAGAKRLETHPLGQTNGLRRVGVLDELCEVLRLFDYQFHVTIIMSEHGG